MNIKLSILSILTLLILSNHLIISQQNNLNKTIRLDVHEKTATEVLKRIADNADVRFSYHSEIIQDSLLFSIDSADYTISEILHQVFPDNYRFDSFENHIIILAGSHEHRHEHIKKQSKQESYFTLRGEILDYHNKKPIPFAHINIAGTQKGTISNESGIFALKINAFSENDSLVISYIGYEKNVKPLLKSQEIHTYLLKRSSLKIPEIHVTPNSPTFIIEKALLNVSENYSCNPEMLTAFFRETNTLNKSYLSISEAVISIYKSAYQNDFMNDKVQILKARKNQNFAPLKNYNIKVAGGLYYNLKLDIAKARPTYIDPEYFHFYDYQFDTSTNYFGRRAYVINFDQKDWVQDAMFKGKLFIDIETKAFAGAEYQVSPKGLAFASKYLIQKKPLSYRIEPVITRYLVNYRYHQGKWILNHGRSKVVLNIKDRKKEKESLFATTSEFLITSRIDTNVRQYRFSRTVGAHDVFVEQIDDYDESFWGTYNIIEPGKDLKNAYRQLNVNETILLIDKHIQE